MFSQMWLWFALKLATAGLGAMVLHIGIGGAVIVGLLAAAWFSPIFKKELVWAAAVVAVFLFAEGIGIHDEAGRCKAKVVVIEKQVDKIVHDSVSPSKKKQRDPWDDPSN